MNCARVIFVLLALFQYGWAATSPEATSLASAIRCYGLLHVEAKRLGVVKPDGSLNWDAACTATQAFVDCFEEAAGSGWVMDVNRVINWQMCRANRVLGLCPRANCNDLRKKSDKTDYWKNLALPASKKRQKKCAKPLHAECDRIYLDALVNLKSMVPYYLCYLNGYKTCPSQDLAGLTIIYEDAMTPGTRMNQLFAQMRGGMEEILKAHGS